MDFKLKFERTSRSPCPTHLDHQSSEEGRQMSPRGQHEDQSNTSGPLGGRRQRVCLMLMNIIHRLYKGVCLMLMNIINRLYKGVCLMLMNIINRLYKGIFLMYNLY